MHPSFGYVVLGVPLRGARPLIDAASVDYQAGTYEQASRMIPRSSRWSARCGPQRIST